MPQSPMSRKTPITGTNQGSEENAETGGTSNPGGSGKTDRAPSYGRKDGKCPADPRCHLREPGFHFLVLRPVGIVVAVRLLLTPPRPISEASGTTLEAI